MAQANPQYILRNHMAQKAIELAASVMIFLEVERLFNLLSQPFSKQPELEQVGDQGHCQVMYLKSWSSCSS